MYVESCGGLALLASVLFCQIYFSLDLYNGGGELIATMTNVLNSQSYENMGQVEKYQLSFNI